MIRGTLPALAAVCMLAGPTGAIAAGSPAPLDRRLSLGDRDLVLRSASLREVTFFKVNVYWVGLYLETSSTPSDSVFSSSQVKAFVFHFMRDVKSDKLQESWIQDLTDACESNCGSVIAQGKVLARRMPDIRTSQEVAYVLFPDRVDVLVNGRELGALHGRSASQAILATFLGPTAPSQMRRDLIDPLGRSPRSR